MIPFADLPAQHARIRHELAPVLDDVLERGEFVLGRHVAAFESAFAAYSGAAHGIGVNSGTSALHLALLAAGVGPGTEVITTAFSFVATAAAIGYTGATPVLVDIEPRRFTIDPARLEAVITPRTRAIVPVHLYGHPADLDPILALARHYGLAVIEDAAQAHGARYHGRPVGGIGDAGCFSFYPAKNLGACGEGGMVVTSRPEWNRSIRQLRDWGLSPDQPYRHMVKAFNYRMDAIQGAVLGVKLRHLGGWTATRRANAACYDAAVAGPDLVATPPASWAEPVYHLYVMRARHRAAAQELFRQRGIETRIHYPVPIHLLDAWHDLGYRRGDFPHAERAAEQVLSIPVHPELAPSQRDHIAQAIRDISIGQAAPLEQSVAARRRAAS